MKSLYFINKYVSMNTYNIKLYKNNNNIGSSIFSLNNKTATINNIEIDKKYRNLNYGSMLLYNIENNIKYIHNINKIILLAWQPSGSTNVIDFFKKNQYIHNYNDKINTYDDSVVIYDLYHFMKKI